MALMSGLTQPRGSINAVLAQYPMTDALRRDEVGVLVDGTTSPPARIVDEHMAAVVPGAVVSSAIPYARMDLSYALSANGRYREFFGGDRLLWPLYLVEQKEYLPPTWIVHGDADQAVSVEDSKAFVEKARRLGGEVRLVVRPGEDHGFDVAVKENEEEWLREGVSWVEKKWLG